ncbi:LacI family DNA-binding transcriptional regulator [Paracoccus shanxieyensis]|uniref:LacI family DNA-binding transcriptional regulator n=1 Tax=Paracoccus shanxieyensis TaxID=2675752 RepID=A0A6L6IWV6_9RHOB|nr:LacI family DNA-binding transcriptional regulator [Paracoccus shanxieyensis]MTH64098.1 LacI family DNA-binding transcriptional regulator [Paracoccus shanxieyensis]MTH86861.1 LacI family DNA-binding transcriptional regulator [Paracoccus shanxieyensis]
MITRKRANLRQIADALGLSVTTVSRALKDGPEVRPATIARVKAAARAAGYSPNAHGVALRTGRTHTLTVILPLETQAYLADLAKVPLIEGMTMAARQAGYTLSIHSVGSDDDQLAVLRHLHLSGGTDGVIITRIVAQDPRLAFLAECDLPYVTFGRSDRSFDHAYVDIDNEAMAHHATSFLLARGHRRIGLQLLSREDLISAARVRGFAQAHADLGLPVDDPLFGYDHFTMMESETLFHRMLCDPHPPTALICASELGLLGAASALRKRGLAPGTDVALVTRDTSRMTGFLALKALVHSVDMADIGRALVLSLIERIVTPGLPPRHVLMPGTFEEVGA